MKWLLLIGFLCVHSKSWATYIDLNTLSFSDQFTAATTTQNSRTQYDLGLGFEVTKSHQILIALATGASTFTDTTATATTKFAIADTGLKFIFFWTKSKAWSTAATYNFISTAKYDDGTTPVELRGSSLKVDMGYNFWLGEYFAIGVKIFYYAATYKESVDNNIITPVSYKRTLTYPSLSLVYDY